MHRSNTRNSHTSRHSGLSRYYPFGMQMQGREFAGGMGYRWGFNGKEVTKSYIDFGERYFRSGLGRWLSCDLLTALSKQQLSPYQGMRNCPTTYVDLDGNDEFIRKIVTDNNGNTYTTFQRVSNRYAEFTREAPNLLDKRDFHRYIAYHNIYTTTIEIEDGFGNRQLLSSSTENSEKPAYTRHPLFTWIPRNFVFSGYGGEQKGGLHLTAGIGGIDPTKYIIRDGKVNGNARDITTVDLNTLLGALVRTYTPGRRKFDPLDLWSNVSDLVQELGEELMTRDVSVWKIAESNDFMHQTPDAFGRIAAPCHEGLGNKEHVDAMLGVGTFDRYTKPKEVAK